MSEGSESKLNPLAEAVAFVLRRSRPPFHTAVFVLYWSFMGVPIAWTAVLVRRLFGDQVTVDYGLLGFFAASLGVGALASAAYEFLFPQRVSAWISCAIFGFVAGYVGLQLADLKNGDAINSIAGFLVGAVSALSFVLLRWLMLKEAKASAA